MSRFTVTLDDSSVLMAMRKVRLSRGRRALLDDVSWTVRAGEHWAVLGGNGAGKSTLLQAALGLLWPDQAGGGRIIWQVRGQVETSPLAVREVSALISPQTQDWYARNAQDLSGEDLLLCGLYGTPRIYRAVSEQDRKLAQDLAARLNLTSLLDMSLEAMSQGQLRRMLIASACLGGPRLLALDEAADGLDAAGREALFALLAKLSGPGAGRLPAGGQAGGQAAPAGWGGATNDGQAVGPVTGPVTMLMAAHRKEDLPPFITHVVHLEAGRIIRQEAITGCELAPAERLGAEACSRAVCAPSAGPSGLHIQAAPFPAGQAARRRPNPGPREPAAAAPPLLELRNVSVFLGRRPVLRGLNWRVEQGEHWAVAGPNGSGKTTLLRLIWGEIPVALGGELLRLGRPGPFNTQALRRGMGLVSDRVHQAMPKDMLVEDVILSGFFGSIGLYEEPAAQMYPALAEMMERMGLEQLGGRVFGSLSFGEARRLLLARALVHKPALLLLDEAFSGLDSRARSALARDLSLAAQSGQVQIIQVSHHPADFIAEIDNILYLEPCA